MKNEQIALMELLTVGGLGFLLLAAGLIGYILRRRKGRHCTGSTVGNVVKHKYAGEGRMNPIIRYCVDGREYSVKRNFNGIVTTKKVSPSHLYVEKGAYVSDRDYLHVPMSAVTNCREMANALWPIGSEMKVFYNPENPKQAYAERIPKGMSLASVVFIGSGIFVMLLSVGMYFVIRFTG